MLLLFNVWFFSFFISFFGNIFILLFSFSSFFISEPFSFFNDISVIFIVLFVLFVVFIILLGSFNVGITILLENSFIFFLINVDNSVLEPILLFFFLPFVLKFKLFVLFCLYELKSCPLFFILFCTILFTVTFVTINFGFELLNEFLFLFKFVFIWSIFLVLNILLFEELPENFLLLSFIFIFFHFLQF